MSEAVPLSTTRPEWQTHEGYTYIADVAFKVFDDLGKQRPARIHKTDYKHLFASTEGMNDLSPSRASLYIGMAHMARAIPAHHDLLAANYGITATDRILSHGYSFQEGLEDMNFAWHFAPALGAAVVDHFIDQDVLPAEKANDWELPDWANIIGTGWFSKLAHSMAYTANGVYGPFGQYPWHYAKGALRTHLARTGIDLDDAATLFETKEAIEPDTGHMHTTAVMSKPLRAALRRELHNGRSVGCPMARYGSMIFKHMVDNDPHTSNLINSGKAEIVPERTTETEIMLRTPWSPIDVSLAVLANKFDQYHGLYGTPYFNSERYEIEHRRRSEIVAD